MSLSGFPARVERAVAGQRLREQLMSATEAATALCEEGRQQRSRSKRCRQSVTTRRTDTIRLIWKARQLRIDRGGGISMIWHDRPSPDGQAGLSDPPVHVVDTVNRLFDISLDIANLQRLAADHEIEKRLATVVEKLDALIRDVRQAAVEKLDGEAVCGRNAHVAVSEG